MAAAPQAAPGHSHEDVLKYRIIGVEKRGFDMNEILTALYARKSMRTYTEEPVSPEKKELINLPSCVFPAVMLVIGAPTQQQLERPKPERVERCPPSPA